MMGHQSTSTEEEQDPLDGIENTSANIDHTLAMFWNKVLDDVRVVQADEFKNQVLPLARIKKIMKLDEDVKMMSAEVPLLFAKACEIFIHELTIRSWSHTEDNKRRTLQRNDIAMAITKSDQFDFLIDIVPRYEVNPVKVKEEISVVRAPVNAEQIQYYLQLAQQHQAALQTNPTPQQQIQIIQPHQLQQLQQQQQQQQQQQSQQQSAAGSSSSATPIVLASSPTTSAAGASNSTASPTLYIVQQLVSAPNGEVQQIPVQLNQQQMNLLRMQIQGNSGAPIMIQQQQQPQIIQVASQPQQVYLTQVGTSQDGD